MKDIFYFFLIMLILVLLIDGLAVKVNDEVFDIKVGISREDE